MNQKEIRRILKDTDYIHTSGTAEELRAAEYLRARCEVLGAKAWLESFPVVMSDMHEAHLYADGKEIPCEGFRCCGNWDTEAEFFYMPHADEVSFSQCRGKIVLLDSGVSHFLYKDLWDNGAEGVITYDGSVLYADRDIDSRELRESVACGHLLPGVNINAKDAFALVKNGTKRIRITINETVYPGESRNVVAELPGESDEWIILSAHYDTKPLSRGSYDNMSGCIGLLSVLEALRGEKLRYGLRFLFCGSEERGLLGSKAYTEQHESELDKVVLNVNLDMIGSVMGGFLACCSTDEAFISYLRGLCRESGWSTEIRQGVYSSDSTPFADKGVPALSFARLATSSQAAIHTRYDTPAILSPAQLQKDSEFITLFTRRMATAALCPVNRVIPQKVRDELDVYLFRKRKETV